MSIAERIARASGRFYDRTRSKKALDAATAEPVGSINDLKGKKYCLLVTYKKDGTPVPSPLWFGVGDGKVYAETGAEDWKVKRIRNNPNVLIAPCDTRGKPTGAPFRGTARIVEPHEEAEADRIIQTNYGVFRKIYEGALAHRVDTVNIEVTPT